VVLRCSRHCRATSGARRSCRELPGAGFTKESFEAHVREEFSTFNWVLKGMADRAGMTVIESKFPLPWYGKLISTRNG